LIERAIGTVTTVLEHEIIIAIFAILLILTHFRSVFVVVITLPLSILIAFILMSWFGISSNIMSLSGIAISIGILVDQAIVMLENSTHHLTLKFGQEKIRGDTIEIVVNACRQVGRPIFFSVMIMIISFLPVFTLRGQEGKLFHPLAFTKTFALIGTAIMSVTLVPALIPLLIRGRLSKEENNWIIRTVIEMYRPVLSFLMRRPKTVIWLFVILLAIGFYFARHLGREFMPPLDEGSILDMPITVPRASVTEVADDLKARDALIRVLPEVEMVVGKAGRAETPTDPSPLDMVESVITLKPKEYWLKRKIKFEDAYQEADRILNLLETQNFIRRFSPLEERKSFINGAVNSALEGYDNQMHSIIIKHQIEFEEHLADKSVRFIGERVISQIDEHQSWEHLLTAEEREVFLKELTDAYRKDFRNGVLLYDVESVVDSAFQTLSQKGFLSKNIVDVLAPYQTRLKVFLKPLRESFGFKEKDFYVRTADLLEKFRNDITHKWVRQTNHIIFYPAVSSFEESLLKEIKSIGIMEKRWNDNLPGIESLEGEWLRSRIKEFGEKVFLWTKTKSDIVQELDRSVRMLGWANIWTQPIINRVDMLATGVRTQIGVKVFGRTSEQIQEVSNKVSDVLRGIQGAVDVVADQIVGKGYIEIEIDREQSARYGISVGDIQDVIEVALGGKLITTTVEGRERYPVRLRYARDYRVDEESIKRILVSANDGSEISAFGKMSGKSSSLKTDTKSDLYSVYLGDVAKVQVVEGPVVIKSENGLLRSYVQLNVRDRDIVGFVEEAQRNVPSKVKLPEGCYLEWTGQFEHQIRAKQTLRIVFPAVLLLIFLILYITYNDFTHAVLMMLAVPGALAGGVIFQKIFGYNFSVAVWVGYIACFGMATETGIIMLVYLRDAIATRGGLENIQTLEELEQAILSGAIHRLRPKLLTEATAIVGLAPMLWARGVGAEVIAPMAAPVLGGLLIADEVIDIFLPVLFYQVEKRRWKKIHQN